jgi:nitrogen fixation NifU-like protein
MYNETVLHHFQNPRNVGEIKDANGIGIYMSEFCGDITKFWITVHDGTITDATYRTQGCAASIACGSVLTELVQNKPVTEALRITKHDIIAALDGLPEQKIHCSVLADDALKDAICDYLTRNQLSVPRELVHKREKIQPLLKEMKRRGHIFI